MATAQGDRQASVRALTGSAGTYEGDFHALFNQAGIPAGDFNGRMLAWLRSVGGSANDLPGAMAAYALAQGAVNWSSLGTVNSAVAPDAVTSAPLTEYFVFDQASTFSDTGGTTPAVLGGPVALVKAKGGRSETLTQASAGNQPIFDLEPKTGRPSIIGNGSSAHMSRSYAGEVGTTIVVYAPHRVATRLNQVILSTPAAGDFGFFLLSDWLNAPTVDAAAHWRARTDGSAAAAFSSAVVGAVDVLGSRTDGTNYELNRSGKVAASSVVSSGVPVRPLAGTVAGFMAAYDSSSAAQWYFKGNVLAFATFSGKVSDAEMAGLMQWGKSLARQAWAGNWLGMFFGGNATNEDGSLVAPIVVQSSDLMNWSYRPISAAPHNWPGASSVFLRDPGIIADASGNVFVAHTSASDGLSFDLLKSSNAFDFAYLNTISTTAIASGGTGAASWAPEFVRNQDGSMWLDGAGKPAIVFSCSPNGNFTMKPAFVQPADLTWTTGGAWNAPAFLTSATSWGGTEIDCSCMYVGGVFHLLTAGQGTDSSYINYRTATNLAGPWTDQGVLNIKQGFEAPQVHWLGGTTYLLHLDYQGLGYFYAISTTGIGGPYCTPIPVNAPFSPQHGTMIPLPAGWGSSGAPYVAPSVAIASAKIPSGLVDYWDADTLSAGPVASWAGKINGLALAQADVTKQPACGLKAANGLPGLSFYGACMTNAALNTLDGPFHVFAVASVYSGNNYSPLLAANTAGADGAVGIGFAPGNKLDLQRLGQADTASTIGMDNGAPAIIEWSSAAGLSGGSITATPALNGTVGSALTVTGYAAAHSGIVLAGDGKQAGGRFGAMGALMIFNRVLSAAEADTVRGLLAWKFNLISVLPASSAYKTAAP